MDELQIIMTPEEMTNRFKNKDDPFDLVIEKWERLGVFLENAFSLDDYNLFLAACQVPIPFCQMYGVEGHCNLCPNSRDLSRERGG